MANDPCPDCGRERSQGLCPHCLLLLGMGNADSLAETQIEPPAQVARTVSVLETLAATIGSVPNVLLRETAVGEATSQVFRPTPGRSETSTRFRVDGEIARGGMGAVLRGRDPDLGRDVAIKVLREDLRTNGDFIRRFVEEAQIGGQLQHPGVVPIYELGTFGDGRPFFCMKLVKGKTLAELLGAREDPADDLSRFLGIFATMAQTMAYSHTRGVIHRDLKPSNVMLGSFGEVQVMDWGLAKVLPRGGVVDDARAGKHDLSETLVATARSGSDTDLSQAGSVLGTPSYMAPEQARGEIERMDERADVFALGSILTEILTGSPAHTGNSVSDILRKAARGDTADAVSRLRACGADADLIDLATDCLASEPDDRPRDGNVVSQRIVGYLDGIQERIQAAMRERAVAEARAVEERKQRRLQLGLAASVLALVGLGAGGFAWTQQQRAEAARERAARVIRVAAGIDDALAAAERLRGEAQVADVESAPARWALALAAADRAADQVAQVGADETRTARVNRLRDELRRGKQAADERLANRRVDHTLVTALEEARANMGVHFDLNRVAKDYDAAFRAAGLDIANIDPGKAGIWIAGRGETRGMVEGLDDWAWVCTRLSRPRKEVDQIVAIARAADSDPWRNTLRDQYLDRDRDNFARLVKLADDPAIRNQPPSNLVLLAHQFGKEQTNESIRILRQAQQRHPTDYWVHMELANAIKRLPADPTQQNARDADVLRFLTVAHALRPQSGSTTEQLDRALIQWGHLDEVVAMNREAVASGIDPVAAHTRLGEHLRSQGKLEEACAEYREVIRLTPTAYMPRSVMGQIREAQGKSNEAIAEYREAVRLNPKDAWAYGRIVDLLMKQRNLDEAIAAAREGIQFNPNSDNLHWKLAEFFAQRKRFDEAVGEWREVIRLKPNEANPHLNLGVMLINLKRIEESITEYRESIRLKPSALGYANLSAALIEQGQIKDALASITEACRLDPQNPDSMRKRAILLLDVDEVDEAIAAGRKAVDLTTDGTPERIVSVITLAGVEQTAKRITQYQAILNGAEPPSNLQDQLGLSQIANRRRHPTLSLRLVLKAMEAHPEILDNRNLQPRYNAACFAARIADHVGIDEPIPDEATRADHRGRALGWLRAELGVWQKLIETGPEKARLLAQRNLERWKTDPDLAGVRDPEALLKLPETERAAWQTLWRDVDSLIAQAKPGESNPKVPAPAAKPSTP